jgi:CRP/FNR family transcriptional regulator, cyclic AMP receptor protein
VSRVLRQFDGVYLRILEKSLGSATKSGANRRDFDPKKFLATIGEGRKVVAFPKKQSVFSQGPTADAVFYIQQGKVRLTVVSNDGKEATLGILSVGDFFGEGSLAGQAVRMGSATAMTDCEILRVDKKAMMLALHREHTLSDLFVTYLLERNIRCEEDLVDQLFNSSEKRLARLLLLLAHFGKEGVPETVVPKISQETLAEMIGTTRSRVSFFMNRFRKLGFLRLWRERDASSSFTSKHCSPRLVRAAVPQTRAFQTAMSKIRRLLDLVRESAPFSSPRVPPTELPCFERFLRW